MNVSEPGPELQKEMNFRRFFRNAEWKLRFAVLPHHCAISNKLLWYTYAYRGRQTITGPGTPVYVDEWLCKEEYLLKVLKETK